MPEEPNLADEDILDMQMISPVLMTLNSEVLPPVIGGLKTLPSEVEESDEEDMQINDLNRAVSDLIKEEKELESPDKQIDTNLGEMPPLDKKSSSIDILEDPVNLRIAMLGNVDAGKSTLTGLLTSAPGTKDDGRGALRSAVANF